MSRCQLKQHQSSCARQHQSCAAGEANTGTGEDCCGELCQGGHGTGGAGPWSFETFSRTWNYLKEVPETACSRNFSICCSRSWSVTREHIEFQPWSCHVCTWQLQPKLQLLKPMGGAPSLTFQIHMLPLMHLRSHASFLPGSEAKPRERQRSRFLWCLVRAEGQRTMKLR